MAELFNLRRVRKAKARAEKNKIAEANRMEHGVAKPARKLAKARVEKAEQTLTGQRLEPNK